jgi:hypothetical protein
MIDALIFFQLFSVYKKIIESSRRVNILLHKELKNSWKSHLFCIKLAVNLVVVSQIQILQIILK